jgi:radial spoke head protein 4A
LKKILTGNLNAEIFGFPGKERNLLRAQLARIQHATNIVPKGIFEMDEESGGMKYAEEGPDLSSEPLKSLENWCSVDPIILKVGRCTHTEPTHVPEEEREAYKEKLAEEDKTEEPLKAIFEHTPVGTDTAWTVKTVGDTQAYNKVGGEGTTSYAINLIKSNRWPGHVTVAKNG